MAKHTSGPWKVCNGPDHEADDVILNSFRIEAPIGDEDPYRGSIAMLQSCGHIQGITRKECAANARLIAAAPELLDALYEMAEYLADREDVVDGDYGQPAPNKEMNLLREVREAIYKATGEKV